jgi:MarR family transcriptional regulator, organic hydroperoxide resistance regulator
VILNSATGNLIALHRLHRAALEPRLTKLGLNYAAELALEAVGESERLTMTELANRLDVTQPSVSKVVRSLERRRLVDRVADELDGRVTRLELTERGRGLRVAVHAAWKAAARETFGDLSAGDRAALMKLLHRALASGRPS